MNYCAEFYMDLFAFLQNCFKYYMSDDISKDSEEMDEQCRYMDGMIKGSLAFSFLCVYIFVCVLYVLYVFNGVSVANV